MTFLWLAFAVLTAGVLAAVLAPLGRRAPADAAAAAGALAVYRDQLAELDRDAARGLIDPAEAAAARLEISRRLLAADAGEPTPAGAGPAPRRQVALALAILTPLLTLGLYLAQGSPMQPSSPLSSRREAALVDAQLGDLVAKVEARLRAHPEDGDGWDVIAPVYFKLGRMREAADAWARAVDLKGETVRRLAGLAEATVLAADGIVTEDARRAYEKILKLEPGRIEARFWLALAREQDGDLRAALAEYQALLAAAPADAPWRGPLAERIGDLTRRLAPGAKAEPPGPGPADVAAFQKLAPEERQRLIAQMVDGLAQRLERDGADLAGWQRLVNAYAVLGRSDDARKALARARRQFDGDAQALAALAALAKTLGLGS
jgi:cytochrome c-type biogenesis protein CcmH